MSDYRTRPTHPITGRRIRLHASSAGELAAYVHRIDELRTKLRLGMVTEAEVNRELRRLQHGIVTVERAARAYIARADIAQATRDQVRSLVKTHMRFLGLVPLDACDGPVMRRWIDELHAAGLEPTTVATQWRWMRAIARYATELGWSGETPWGLYRPKLSSRSSRTPREAARTIEELVLILAAAQTLDRGAFDPERRIAGGLEALIAVAALLGLRQGELAGLRWNEIEAGPPLTVLVCRQWVDAPVKGRRAMRLESIAELGAILESYRERLEACGLYDPKGPVFPVRRKLRPAPYTRGEVLPTLHLRAAVHRAGLPHEGAWSAHSLRDTFVTLEAGATGGDLVRVQLRSRHASLSSLARYLRALSRSHPASPAVTELPGRSTGDAGPPLLDAHDPSPKETPS